MKHPLLLQKALQFKTTDIQSETSYFASILAKDNLMKNE